MRFIFGMATVGNSLKLLLDMRDIWKKFYFSAANFSGHTD
ncbi:Uncharacterized protein dnm_030960 [Desulfonema magnum]|uniref:Uncharacterized protein n=1 Tax=Desulfonema magnum TaxID=45655 RepID=A0A975BL36_9BACT|nr:Uncharacterized protein dnm_030960 [Desulfonema magnum]